MGEAFKFLGANSFAALAVSITILLLGFTVAVLCVVAFIQGRSLTFWPPAIGERPAAKLTVSQPEGPSVLTVAVVDPVVDAGTVLVGASGLSYQVVSEVYRGTSASVYKALDSNKREVIAKVFWRGLTPNSGPWQLFKREQRSAEVLKHRNIVQVFDRGLRSGYPFTVMEFFGGGTLRDWLETHNRVRGQDIVSIASQLAEAVDYAHSMGVIHRDIKPGNILLAATPNDRVALSDFGIAIVLGALQHNITAAQEFTGSPGYLAPELLRGMTATPSADIYSVGIVLFEMICGRGPFDDQRETFALMLAKIDKDAPDVRVFRPDAPPELALRVAQTLSRDPLARPSSARAVLSGIEGALSSL